MTMSGATTTPTSELLHELLPRCLVIRFSNNSSEPETTNSRATPIDGLRVFNEFMIANLTSCQDASLRNSVAGLVYIGSVLTDRLLIGGAGESLEAVKSAWSRRLLKGIPRRTITEIGEVDGVRARVINQSNFVPLWDALVSAVVDLNRCNVPATEANVCLHLLDAYEYDKVPPRHVIRSKLRELVEKQRLMLTGKVYMRAFPEKYAARGSSKRSRSEDTLHRKRHKQTQVSFAAGLDRSVSVAQMASKGDDGVAAASNGVIPSSVSRGHIANGRIGHRRAHIPRSTSLKLAEPPPKKETTIDATAASTPDHQPKIKSTTPVQRKPSVLKTLMDRFFAGGTRATDKATGQIAEEQLVESGPGAAEPYKRRQPKAAEREPPRAAQLGARLSRHESVKNGTTADEMMNSPRYATPPQRTDGDGASEGPKLDQRMSEIVTAESDRPHAGGKHSKRYYARQTTNGQVRQAAPEPKKEDPGNECELCALEAKARRSIDTLSDSATAVPSVGSTLELLYTAELPKTGSDSERLQNRRMLFGVLGIV